MNCSFQGCPGSYEDRRVLHTVRSDGRVVVIDQVPAEVCDTCAEVLLSPETVSRLESMLSKVGDAPRTAPVYDYA